MPSYQSDLGTWHFSRIDAYLTCPQREAMRRAGEPSCPTPAMRRGTEVHEGAARICRDCRERGKAKAGESGKHIARGYDEEVEEILVAFAEEATVPLAAEPLYIEQGFSCELPNGEPWCGTLDLAYREEGADKNPFASSEDKWTVIDWKTFAPAYMDDEAVPLQLESYGYLLQRQHPDAENIHVGIGAMQAHGGWRVRFWTLPEDLRAVGEKLSAMVDRIMADTELRPNPGEACTDCTFIMACPYAQSATAQAVLGMAGEALQLAQNIEAAQATIRQWQAILRKHEKANGPLVMPDGREWKWCSKTGLRPANPALLIDKLRKKGLDWPAVLGDYGKTKCQKLIDDGVLAEDDFVSVTTGREFKPVKIGNDGNGAEQNGDGSAD